MNNYQLFPILFNISNPTLGEFGTITITDKVGDTIAVKPAVIGDKPYGSVSDGVFLNIVPGDNRGLLELRWAQYYSLNQAPKGAVITLKLLGREETKGITTYDDIFACLPEPTALLESKQKAFLAYVADAHAFALGEETTESAVNRAIAEMAKLYESEFDITVPGIMDMTNPCTRFAFPGVADILLAKCTGTGTKV
jgi:hypothetical protein